VVLASAVRPGFTFDEVEVPSAPFREVLVVSETAGADFRWSDPSYARTWSALLSEVRPDVVHLHHYYHVGIDLPLVARGAVPDAAIVMTLHEYLAICLMSGQMVDRLGHLCLRSSVPACAECVAWPQPTVAARQHYVFTALQNVDAFVTPSHFARDRYVHWGLDPRHVHVVPNALDLPVRTDTVAPRSGPLRLTYIGQHTPYKGIETLLAAVEKAAELQPGALAPVRVFGGGSDQFGPEFVERLNAARVRCGSLASFEGEYRAEDVAQILENTDAIVVPSTWWENSPVVIEEALARRVPVICSDTGGMAERVEHGRDGWHFPVGNASALAELLLDLARRWPMTLPDMRTPEPLEAVTRQHLDLYAGAIASHLTRRRKQAG
jgi:glycosyltransferase involved in cell wall biosynthesis